MNVRIWQAIDIGCTTSALLPDIENCIEVPDFFEKLVPKQGHQFYLSVLGSYKTISNALLTFFLRPETVKDSAPKTVQAIQSIWGLLRWICILSNHTSPIVATIWWRASRSTNWNGKSNPYPWWRLQNTSYQSNQSSLAIVCVFNQTTSNA